MIQHVYGTTAMHARKVVVSDWCHLGATLHDCMTGVQTQSPTSGVNSHGAANCLLGPTHLLF